MHALCTVQRAVPVQTDRDKLASARGAAHGVAGTQLKRPRAVVLRRRGAAHCSRAPSLVHALCQNFKTARRVVSDGTVPPSNRPTELPGKDTTCVLASMHACMEIPGAAKKRTNKQTKNRV